MGGAQNWAASRATVKVLPYKLLAEALIVALVRVSCVPLAILSCSAPAY
jgi:hypothetical protein